jgi:hypothetical protein
LTAEVKEINFCLMVHIGDEVNARASWHPGVWRGSQIRHPCHFLRVGAVGPGARQPSLAGKIYILAGGGFERIGSFSFSNSYGVAAGGRYFPDRRFAGILSVDEVDPTPIVGPTGHVVTLDVDAQLVRHAAVRVDRVDIGFATHPRIKGDQPAIGRPARRASRQNPIGGQLHCIRTVGVANPHFGAASAVRLKSDFGPVWRDIRGDLLAGRHNKFSSRRGDADKSRRQIFTFFTPCT